MRISNFIFHTFFIVFTMIVYLSLLLNIEYLYIRQIISSAYVMLVPGFFLLKLLNVKKIGSIPFYLYSASLSLIFLIFSGLFINLVFSFRGIGPAFAYNPVVFGINGFIILLYVLNIFKKTNFELSITTSRNAHNIFFIFPLLFPLLSIFGAISLNNGRSNLLTMLNMTLIAVYSLCLIIYRKKVLSYEYAWALLMTGISILFMESLRSNYISGYDISKEFFVFQLTKNNGYWSINEFRDAYNACLSITILPTILSIITNIRDENIYKVVYQIIFAHILVGLFLFYRRLVKPVVAFLACLFFLSQPWFLDPMVTLARQEIALLFFMMVLLLLFNPDIKSRAGKVLLLSFTIGLVVSHYSTTYIVMVFFTCLYICVSVMKYLIRRNLFSTHRFLSPLIIHRTDAFSLSFTYLLVLITTSVLWYSQITPSARNLSDVAKSTFVNLQHLFSEELRAGIVSQVLSGNSQIGGIKQYNEYYNKVSREYKRNPDVTTYVSDNNDIFQLIPKYPEALDVKNQNVYIVVAFIYKAHLAIVALCFICGLLSIIIFPKISGSSLPIEYLISVLFMCMALALIMILPYLSIAYNFDRLYMQAIIFLSLINTLGAIAFAKFFRLSRFKYIVTGGFYVLIFLFTYAFIWQIVGGKTVIWLNNIGYHYSLIFTHKTEVYSANWLNSQKAYERIYADPAGKNKVVAYGKKLNISTDIFPSTVDRYSYVYLTKTNYKESVGYFFYRGINIGYLYPLKFLSENKNQVYNNGSSTIYK